MLISLDEAVLVKYPECQIGYMLAHVRVKKSDPFVEYLKEALTAFLTKNGINRANFAAHPAVQLWRKIYEEDFCLKAKSYPSSIEALLRRVATGRGIWNISTVVDLYNVCSVFSLLPMGGYDFNKISRNVQIRFAREGESFYGLGGCRATATSNQVVYSDSERIISWLWNHKDARETSIDENTTKALFFIDSFNQTQTEFALQILEEKLHQISCSSITTGILNHENSKVDLKELL